MPEASRGLEGVIANTTRLSDVIGDKGQLIYGELSGRPILAFTGRLHFYEGHSWERVVRTVEIAAEVAGLPSSVITKQVANGVAVRMAVLYLLLGSGVDLAAA